MARTPLHQYLDACRHVSIEPRDELAFAKLVTLNLRGAENREQLLRTVFRDVADEERLYVDWGKVPDMFKHVSDSGFWVYMLQQFCDVAMPPGLQPAPLRALSTRMGEAGLPTEWQHVARVCVLMNIERVQSVHSVEQYLGTVTRASVQQSCMRLLSSMADTRYTPEEHAATMHWLLRRCVSVKAAALAAGLDALQRSMDISRHALHMRSLQTSNGRVRLRDRLRTKQTRTVAAASGTFGAFQSAVNFAVTMSRNMQLRAYMIMAQVAVDKPRALDLVLPPDVVRLVADRHVADPEVAVIKNVISRMSYSRSPFAALSAFHRECFSAVALSQKNMLTLTLLMQLYVASYQSIHIWQECWLDVLPVMNSQLKSDVEGFLARNPEMNVEAFAYSLQAMV